MEQKDYQRIYLQPECCADDDGRLWCQDDEPQTCPDGQPWTPYVLASEYDTLQAKVAELEEALRESQDWNWISAREEAEDAGRDTFDIPEMQALADLANNTHSKTFALRTQAQGIGALDFPTALRKMWSADEVKVWLKEQADRLQEQANAIDNQ